VSIPAVEAAPRSPGRPRDPELDRAILDATIRILADEGFARLTIEAVAREAGVGKPTIYRRWASKTELVIDALIHRAPTHEGVQEGTVRERLTQLLTDLIKQLQTDPAGKIIAGVVAEIPHDAELAEAIRGMFVTKRRRKVDGLLREGIASGELRADLDLELAADQLVGPIMIRRLLTGGRLSPKLAPKIVDCFFDGWGTASVRRA
jgi:AcrR family transcriptional regulator